jgi:Sulfotransferase family
MKTDELPPGRRNATYVLPRWKLVYVSTPKAACTTIKWLLAGLQDLDAKTFWSSLSSETTRATTIHQRRVLWTNTPRLNALKPEELADISADNGWFTFAMTRHPGARLWSAWQSKLLLHEPRFMMQFRDEPWLPRIPSSTEDILEDWQRFMAAVKKNPKTDIMQDVHFQPQAALLNVGVTPYDRLYETSEFSTMLGDLRAHLHRQGYTGELEPERSNETPLPALEEAFTDDVADTIARVYADDFARLPYDDPRPPKLVTGGYSKELVSATAIIAERGDRIGDLSRRARRLHQRAEQAEAQRQPGPNDGHQVAPPERARRGAGLFRR